MLTRTIEVRGPFRFDLALRYLATSPSRIAELVSDESFGRAFEAPSGPVVATVRGLPTGVQVDVTGPGADERSLEQASLMAERVFALAFDPSGAVAIAERDPVVGPYVRRYMGLRPLTIPDPFEALVWAILGQQVNVRFASTMKRALIEAYGRTILVDGVAYWIFPPPERLVDVTPEVLRPLQISRQKASYIGELARAVVEGRIDLEALRGGRDDDVITAATALKGIGLWTAEYLLLRGFGRPDAIPAGDMGIRAILGRLHHLGRNATEAEVRAMAEAWRPWRGLVAFYLWFALQQREYPGAIRSAAPS